jgi:hypothetical protein
MPLHVDGECLDQRGQRFDQRGWRDPATVAAGTATAASVAALGDAGADRFDRCQGFGGPVLFFVVLGGSAALLALWVLLPLLLLRGSR